MVGSFGATMRSLPRDQRLRGFFRRVIEEQQVGDARVLEESPHRAWRTDDRERPLPTRQPGSCAQNLPQAGRVEQFKLAQVQHEIPPALAYSAVQRQLQLGRGGQVDLATDGDARRSVNTDVDYGKGL